MLHRIAQSCAGCIKVVLKECGWRLPLLMRSALYLASPEVENDRRSLNIFHGLRRAKKESRWVTLAPVGYVNLSYENGRKYIAPNESQATIMREAFQELAMGTYTVAQIYHKAKLKGISCGITNFERMIRKPIYCGKVIVPKYNITTKKNIWLKGNMKR